MTALIDTIEAAYKRALQDADGGEVIATGLVVEAIELYCKLPEDFTGSLEGVVDGAYTDARRAWGSTDGPWQTGWIAERVCARLVLLATAPVTA